MITIRYTRRCHFGFFKASHTNLYFYLELSKKVKFTIFIILRKVLHMRPPLHGWLKYCRHGVKLYIINQSINIRASNKFNQNSILLFN